MVLRLTRLTSKWLNGIENHLSLPSKMCNSKSIVSQFILVFFLGMGCQNLWVQKSMYSPHTQAILWQNHLTNGRLLKKLREKLLNLEKLPMKKMLHHSISKYFIYYTTITVWYLKNLFGLRGCLKKPIIAEVHWKDKMVKKPTLKILLETGLRAHQLFISQNQDIHQPTLKSITKPHHQLLSTRSSQDWSLKEKKQTFEVSTKFHL